MHDEFVPMNVELWLHQPAVAAPCQRVRCGCHSQHRWSIQSMLSRISKGPEKSETETRSHPPSQSSLHWRCEKPSCFCSQGIWVNHDHFCQPEVESETLFNHQDLLNWRLVMVGSKAQHLLISSPRPVGGELSFLIPVSSHHQRLCLPQPQPPFIERPVHCF